MSLAETMVRLSRGTPTRRYAMDPAHAAAIRNYLAMATRALGTRSRHGVALRDMQTHIGGKDLSAFNDLLRMLHTEHDPVGLAALDLFSDAADEPHAESPVSDLLQRLRTMSGVLGTPAVGQFTRPGLSGEPIRNVVRNSFFQNGPRSGTAESVNPATLAVVLQNTLLDNSQRSRDPDERRQAGMVHPAFAADLETLSQSNHPLDLLALSRHAEHLAGGGIQRHAVLGNHLLNAVGRSLSPVLQQVTGVPHD